MAFTELLGLKLTAETDGWVKAFAKAEESAAKLGGEVGAFADVMDTTFAKAPANVGALVKKFQEAEARAKSFGTALSGLNVTGGQGLGALVAQTSKASSGLATLEKGVVAFATKLELAGGAIRVVKDYFVDLFERSKTDPALAAVDRLRQTTTDWMLGLRGQVDRFVVGFIEGLERIADRMGQMWFGVGGDTTTRAGMVDTNARENTLRDMGVDPGNALAVARAQSSPGYRESYERYRQQFEERLRRGDIERSNAFQKQVAAQAWTDSAIGQARSFEAMGKLSPSILNPLGEWAEMAGWNAQTRLVGDLRRFWGPSSPRRRGGGRRAAPAAGPSWLGGGVERFGDQLGSMYRAGGAALGRMTAGWGGEPSSDPGLGMAFIGGAGAGLAGRGSTDFERFSEAINDNSTAVGAGFTALSSGITAAVDAALSGSESIGKAFMKASSMALRAIAVESSARAAFETAMGIGASFLAPPAAAAHFAAAGQFAVAAAIAGAGSALLGAGAGGGGGGARAGGYNTPAGGGHVRPANGNAGGGGSVIQVNFGHGFALATKSEIAEALDEATRYGERSGRVRRTAGAVTFR
jgi:hypothetical protein